LRGCKKKGKERNLECSGAVSTVSVNSNIKKRKRKERREEEGRN
jgi:hypothetical protein